MGGTMAKKKSKKLKSIMSTAVLAIIVIAVITFLILKESNADSIVKVNGEKITQQQLDEEYSKLPDQFRGFITQDDYLRQLIDKTLLLQEANNKGIAVEEDELQEQINSVRAQFTTEEEFLQALEQQQITMDDLNVQISERILINTLFEEEVISKIQVSDDDIIDYYRENQAQFTGNEGEIRAAHILLNTEEEAENVLRLLATGADFGDLAREYSVGPSAPSGGYLGSFPKGAMVKEFEDAAFELEINEVSDIVETQFGFHIIMRLDDEVRFEDTKEQIRLTLVQSRQSDALQEYLSDLRDNADIEFSVSQEPVFIATGDELCTEEGKPILRLYTSSTCVSCETTAFFNVLANYDVKVYEWELDTGDNLITSIVESALSKSEFEVLKKYNPNGAVPAYVLGCKYTRIGNLEGDLVSQENSFRDILDELT